MKCSCNTLDNKTCVIEPYLWNYILASAVARIDGGFGDAVVTHWIKSLTGWAILILHTNGSFKKKKVI